MSPAKEASGALRGPADRAVGLQGGLQAVPEGRDDRSRRRADLLLAALPLPRAPVRRRRARRVRAAGADRRRGRTTLREAGAPASTVDSRHQARWTRPSRSAPPRSRALVIGVALSLNGASGAFGAVGRALNVVWRVEEGRGLVHRKLNDLAWTLVVLVLVNVTFVLIFLGGGLASDVAGKIGLGETAASIWRIVRWPAALAVGHGGLRRRLLRRAQRRGAAVPVDHARRRVRRPRRGSSRRPCSSSTSRTSRPYSATYGAFAGGGDPARLAVAHERGAALRRRAQRRRSTCAASPELPTRLRRPAAAGEGRPPSPS